MSQFRKKYDFVFEKIYPTLMLHVPDIIDRISKGGTILEYGCGLGEVTLRFANEFPLATVHGMDLHDAYKTLQQRAGGQLPGMSDLPPNLQFSQLGASGSDHAITLDHSQIKLDAITAIGGIDLCSSWCVFEHVATKYIPLILEQIYQNMNQGGVFYLYVNPLYFSARGAHLYGVLPDPWVHLKMADEELRYLFFAEGRAKGLKNLEEIWFQYTTLNKATAGDLKTYFLDAGFTLVSERYGSDGDPPVSLKGAYNVEALRTKDIELVLLKE